MGDHVNPAASSGLLGVGYEGRTLDELVAHLVAMDVSRLVDVAGAETHPPWSQPS